MYSFDNQKFFLIQNPKFIFSSFGTLFTRTAEGEPIKFKFLFMRMIIFLFSQPFSNTCNVT